MKTQGSVIFVLGDQRFTGKELAKFANKNKKVALLPGIIGASQPDMKVLLALLAQTVPLVLNVKGNRLVVNLRLARYSYCIVTTDKGKEVRRTDSLESYTVEAAVISGALNGLMIDPDSHIAINLFEVTTQPFKLDAVFGNGALRFILREDQPDPVMPLEPPDGFKKLQTIRVEDFFD